VYLANTRARLVKSQHHITRNPIRKGQTLIDLNEDNVLAIYTDGEDLLARRDDGIARDDRSRCHG
jgi:hypothetical protein